MDLWSSRTRVGLMSLTPESLPKHEIIGLEAKVIESTDNSQVNTKGEVLDETQSLLVIEGKRIEKKNCIFQFKLPEGQKIQLDGELIARRPEERVGMKLPEK